MSGTERKELNSIAGTLLTSLGIQITVTENEYDVIRGQMFVGYAEYYLKNITYNESDLGNNVEIEIYKELLEIDSQLGTTQTEQLFKCVFYSVQMDLIRVSVSFIY